MSVINLGRTTKNNITFYQTDGKGRDSYITYNNAGFWKDKHLKIKTSYPRKRFTMFHSLIHQVAPFNYYSDGSGRDTYVMENNAGLVKPFEPLAKQNLQKFLRQGDEYHLFKHKIFLTKNQKKYLNKIKKIQDGVISRLYNDSLEKIKKDKMELRTDSINDFFTKDKIEEIRRCLTPNNIEFDNRNLSYNNYIQNETNTSFNNDKFANLIKKRNKKNILAKILKYSNKNRENNSTLRNINNYNSYETKKENNDNNKKVKVLKNLKINSAGLKFNFTNADVKNKILHNNKMKLFNSLSPKYCISKISHFGFGNLKKYKYKNNNMNLIGNKTTYGTSREMNFKNMKYNFNLKKDKSNIKKQYIDSGIFSLSESNKNNLE